MKIKDKKLSIYFFIIISIIIIIFIYSLVDDYIKINNFVYPDDYTMIITDDTSMLDGPYIEYYIYDDYIIKKTITISPKSISKSITFYYYNNIINSNDIKNEEENSNSLIEIGGNINATFKDGTKCDVSKESIRNWISDKISNAISKKTYAKFRFTIIKSFINL